MDCVRLLVARGADTNAWDQIKHETPLHCAAAGTGPASRDVMEFLYNNNADIDAGINRDGGSVLHTAVRCGNNI